MRRARAAALLAALLLAACAQPPQRSPLASRWVPSPNVDERRATFVVVHYTGSPSAGHALRTLTSANSEVSAHYLVEADGTIVQLADERARAWHAGVSRWGSVPDLNSVSIGIELDNDGRSPYPDAQVASLLRLLADLRQRHRLGPASVLGHSDVAPTRKADPGRLFPWRTLAANGFGPWCETPWPDPPAGFDPWLGLRTIGYDVRRPDAALEAFRMRFLPDAPVPAPIERDAALIQCLVQATLDGPKSAPAAD